ncbi:MAG: hypothetical protein Q8R40_05965 [bacterium]|nr:hypothetical protein [bacterium]
MNEQIDNPQYTRDNFLQQSKQHIEDALRLARNLYRETSHPAIKIKNIILYSYSNPAQETAPKNSYASHFSPFILFMRLAHAYKKDILHIASSGHIAYPAIEIRIPDTEMAFRLARALKPLTHDYFPGLTIGWRLAIKIFSWLLNIHRVILGEKTLAEFCAHNRAFFGSVYINHSGCFVAFHCHDMDAPSQALQTFESLLASHS